jgi:tetratricopeptide (TPR) repeat protein
MSAHKKWTQVLSETERLLNSSDEITDAQFYLDQFETIDENFRDENFPQLYLNFWKIAAQSGKINLANIYAKKSLEYLLIHKRIPKIKALIKEFHAHGIFKKQSREYERKCEILLGKKVDFHREDFKYFNLMDDHPEHWKEFPEFLKQYLMIIEEWSILEWKLCYEFLLYNHFEKEVIFTLMEKAHERGKQDILKNFEKLLISKKIKMKKRDSLEIESIVVSNENLHVDYDQVAMELLSGEKVPNDDEQKRVLNSLKFIPPEELKLRGKDMIVAFELLGMEKVVLTLCEQMVKDVTETKELASLYFIWVQALSNSGEYFKAIDLIDELLHKEPLYAEERMAFLYVKAEACLKLKKIKMAKEIFNDIKKVNPHYRLVKERLKTLETA